MSEREASEELPDGIDREQVGKALLRFGPLFSHFMLSIWTSGKLII